MVQVNVLLTPVSLELFVSISVVSLVHECAWTSQLLIMLPMIEPLWISWRAKRTWCCILFTWKQQVCTLLWKLKIRQHCFYLFAVFALYVDLMKIIKVLHCLLVKSVLLGHLLLGNSVCMMCSSWFVIIRLPLGVVLVDVHGPHLSLLRNAKVIATWLVIFLVPIVLLE